MGPASEGSVGVVVVEVAVASPPSPEPEESGAGCVVVCVGAPSFEEPEPDVSPVLPPLEPSEPRDEVLVSPPPSRLPSRPPSLGPLDVWCSVSLPPPSV
ncbi:MAG: hypothetical protein ACXVFK_18380 [Solirubrobacteraceae bacterium]